MRVRAGAGARSLVYVFGLLLAVSLVSPLCVLAQPGAVKTAPAKAEASKANATAADPAPSGAAADVAGLAQAHEPAGVATATRALDAAAEHLKQVTAILARPGLTEADFSRQRDLVAEAAGVIATTLDALKPHLEAAKSRLAQLGPKPDPASGAPENAQTAAAREELTKSFNDLDAAVKRAKLLTVEAEQAGATISAKRRELLARGILARTYSILSPTLWKEGFDDLPRDLAAATAVQGDWFSALSFNAKRWQIAALAAYVLAAMLALDPLRRLVRRALDRRRRGEAPDKLHRALFALWSALVIAAMPIVAASGAMMLLDAFGMTTTRVTPILAAFADAIARVSITAGLVLGMLAPGRPAWRIFDLSEPVVERIVWLSLRIAAALSAMKILEAAFDAISASVAMTVVARGVTALAVAGMLAQGLSAIARLRLSPDDDRYAALRALGWLAALVIAAAALAGYVAGAAFLVEQIAWASGVAAALYLLVTIVSNGAQRLFGADGRFARALSSMIGLKPQSLPQVAVAASGAINLMLIAVAIELVAAPWGIESRDMLSYAMSAINGVKIGDVELSLGSVASALALFLALWALTRAVQRWLSARLLPATQLDPSLRDAIAASFGYVGVFIAAMAGLAQMGIGVDKIAIVAGALSVGIGFGLQAIVSNFVSGLIVLWERAVRVGDWITVGGEEGYVRRINVRSTEIETFDKGLVVMPNSNLVTGVVTNWLRGDKGGRVKIRVQTRRDADPERVRHILSEVAKAHGSVLRIPAPNVLFRSFDPIGLRFELVAFIDDVEMSVRVSSDLTFAAFAALKAEDLLPPEVPPETVALAAQIAAAGSRPG